MKNGSLPIGDIDSYSILEFLSGSYSSHYYDRFWGLMAPFLSSFSLLRTTPICVFCAINSQPLLPVMEVYDHSGTKSKAVSEDSGSADRIAEILQNARLRESRHRDSKKWKAALTSKIRDSKNLGERSETLRST